MPNNVQKSIRVYKHGNTHCVDAYRLLKFLGLKRRRKQQTLEYIIRKFRLKAGIDFFKEEVYTITKAGRRKNEYHFTLRSAIITIMLKAKYSNINQCLNLISRFTLKQKGGML